MQFVDDAELRAGDADRDAKISELREAYAEGRLLLEEFNDRIDRAQEAKTFADLRPLTADLPRETGIAPEEPSESAMERRKLQSAWASWLGVGVLVNIIWFATWMGSGPAPYYWPIWVVGPWGGAMVMWTLSSRAERSSDD